MLTVNAPFSLPRHGPALVLSILLVCSLAACTGGPPAGTPNPTAPASPSSGGSPNAGGSPNPGGSPIASPSPADPTSQPGPTTTHTTGQGEIEHPTGPTDVILRMEQGGGFVPLEVMVTQAPEFTLYGDGTFIIKPLEDPELPTGWDVPQPRFLQGRLDAAAMQSLLGFALGQGRLLNAKDHYTQNSCADCSSVFFTVNAGGVDKRVTVDALMEITEPGPDAVDRAGFAELVELLRSFEARARAGELGEVVLYEPSHYRVTLLEFFGEPANSPQAWPWDEITPDDFAPAHEFGRPEAILTAEEVALITDVPSGGVPILPVDYEGTIWSLGVRPLLPDEVPQD